MSTLNQETVVQNITRTGEIDGANVRLNFSRENEKTVQITVNADKAAENGMVNVYLDWRAANRHLTIGVNNFDLDDLPMELIEKLLAEMQAVK